MINYYLLTYFQDLKGIKQLYIYLCITAFILAAPNHLSPWKSLRYPEIRLFFFQFLFFFCFPNSSVFSLPISLVLTSYSCWIIRKQQKIHIWNYMRNANIILPMELSMFLMQTNYYYSKFYGRSHWPLSSVLIRFIFLFFLFIYVCKSWNEANMWFEIIIMYHHRCNVCRQIDKLTDLHVSCPQSTYTKIWFQTTNENLTFNFTGRIWIKKESETFAKTVLWRKCNNNNNNNHYTGDGINENMNLMICYIGWWHLKIFLFVSNGTNIFLRWFV